MPEPITFTVGSLEQAAQEFIGVDPNLVFGAPKKMRTSKVSLVAVGTDVEVFLLHAKEHTPVPCVGLIKGTKDKPFPILGGKGFAIQEDNVALEYNIPAAKDAYSFVYNLMKAQEAIEEQFLKPLGVEMAVKPSMRFKPEQLQSKQAKTAGCESDFNVWERKVNEKPDLDDELRGAGGHIHTSFTLMGKKPLMPENLSEIESIIMAYDCFIGGPLTLIDKDTDRRKFYGRAGAFRYKEYGTAAGVEYRVPSNVWTASPALAGWVFGQVERAIEHVNYFGDEAHKRLSAYRGYVEKAINDGDQAAAARLCSDFAVKLPKVTGL